MSFEDLAFLLLPVGPDSTGTVIMADDRWTPVPSRALQHDVVVWGREPLRSGTPLGTAWRSALRRERGLRSVRKAVPTPEIARVHRLPPAHLGGSSARYRLRAALLGGALVELWGTSSVRRVIDAVAERAGGRDPLTTFATGSGGSLVARLHSAGGGDFLLRAARSGTPGDPGRAADALASLGSLGLPQLPRLMRRGEVAGATWSAESLLPGRRPTRVSPNVAAQIVTLCSAIPRSDEPAIAHEDDLRVAADRFPRWGTVLAQVIREATDVARAVPSVARHGDLWAGNVLVRRGRLTGLIDWDAWHPAAFPGVDLLHLVAMEEGKGRRQGLGRSWLGRPWLTDRFRSLTTEYWASMRIVPNERFLQVVGLAWWANQVAATLRRLPHLADDARWVSSNVDPVMETLAGRS